MHIPRTHIVIGVSNVYVQQKERRDRNVEVQSRFVNEFRHDRHLANTDPPFSYFSDSKTLELYMFLGNNEMYHDQTSSKKRRSWIIGINVAFHSYDFSFSL
jgi:hypothetical protein